MTAVWTIDVAIDSAIMADVALLALLNGAKVYNLRATSNAVFPYVVLGASTEVGTPRFGKTGSETTLLIHVWSKLGKKEVVTIYGHLRRLFDRKPLTLSGTFKNVTLALDLVDVSTDPDGVTTHGVVSVRTKNHV